MHLFVKCLGHDIRLQWESRIHIIYALVTIFYLLVLFLLPESMFFEAKRFILFSDPSTLGFFFMGALFCNEWDENIQQTIFSTPLKVKVYIWSKVISLSFLTIASGMMIGLLYTSLNVQYIWLFVALGASGVFFSLLGVLIATKASSLTRFFTHGGWVGAVLFFPYLEGLFIESHLLFYLWPTKPMLELFAVGLGEHQGVVSIIAHMLLLFAWVVGLYKLTIVVFFWQLRGGVRK